MKGVSDSGEVIYMNSFGSYLHNYYGSNYKMIGHFFSKKITEDDTLSIADNFVEGHLSKDASESYLLSSKVESKYDTLWNLGFPSKGYNLQTNFSQNVDIIYFSKYVHSNRQTP